MQHTPISIRYEGDDEQVHTAENDYRCDDPDCPCHSEQSCDLAQEQAPIMTQQAVRLEITFEYPGEYIGHRCCILATQEEEASIFDRSKWQPVSLLEQHFQRLFARKVHVLVVHHC